jgi:hypothetical protein
MADDSDRSPRRGRWSDKLADSDGFPFAVESEFDASPLGDRYRGRNTDADRLGSIDRGWLHINRNDSGRG